MTEFYLHKAAGKWLILYLLQHVIVKTKTTITKHILVFAFSFIKYKGVLQKICVT